MLTLEMVQANFDSWRAKRSGKGKIPNYLWEQALTLIPHYPTSKVANVLRLSGSQISKKLLAHKKSKLVASKKKEVAFAEIPLPPATFEKNISTGGRIEVKRADGTMLIVDNLPEQALMNVLTSFMRAI